MAVVDFTIAQKMVLALANAGPDDFSWSANVGDELFGTTGAASDQGKEAIQEADEEVVLAILETEEHWARPDFFDWSAQLDHLDEVPAHIGATGAVEILVSSGGVFVAGQPATVPEILQWRGATNSSFGSLAHTAAGNALAGFFAIRDNVVHFTGYKLVVKIATYTRTAACQSPNVYMGAVVAGALGRLLAKDSARLAKAEFYYGQQQKLLAAVRANLAVAPVLEQYETAKG